MKKLILASLFVVGSVLAVSAQTETKSCHGNEGGTTKSSCCKSSNSVNTGTSSTTTTKSCCSKGSSHASTGTTNKSTATSATAIFSASKSTATTETSEPK
jgi:hypothetical protein